jgi:hypothetical protein
MKHVYLLVTLILIHFIGLSFSIEGTYQSWSSRKNGPGGEILIHKSPKGEYLFYLEYQMGEPAFNSNAFYGYLTTIDALNYYYQSDEFVIKFEFNELQKTVKANGEIRGQTTYKRGNTTNPKYFTTRTGRDISFDLVPPRSFWE